MTLTPAHPDPTHELLRRQRLLDVYGALLTERQLEACRLHFDEDWSYAELAEHFRCTRSGAHDMVRRGIEHLDGFEAVLGHARDLAECDSRITELEAALDAATRRMA